MLRTTTALASLLLLASACGPKNASKSRKGQDMRKVTEVRLDEADMIMQLVDLNGDGKPNVENHWRERSAGPRLLVMKKIDLDMNGSFDMIQHYSDDGVLKLEEMDKDFDGLVDTRDHYQDGLRILSEMDSNNDGNADIYFHYVKTDAGTTRIDRKERDTTFDGMIDTWERFDESGKVIRMGRDTDGDGKMDEREE